MVICKLYFIWTTKKNKFILLLRWLRQVKAVDFHNLLQRLPSVLSKFHFSSNLRDIQSNLFGIHLWGGWVKVILRFQMSRFRTWQTVLRASLPTFQPQSRSKWFERQEQEMYWCQRPIHNNRILFVWQFQSWNKD